MSVQRAHAHAHTSGIGSCALIIDHQAGCSTAANAGIHACGSARSLLDLIDVGGVHDHPGTRIATRYRRESGRLEVSVGRMAALLGTEGGSGLLEALGVCTLAGQQMIDFGHVIRTIPAQISASARVSIGAPATRDFLSRARPAAGAPKSPQTGLRVACVAGCGPFVSFLSAFTTFSPQRPDSLLSI